MKCLITGANGFLGKKISKIFLNERNEVFCTVKGGKNSGNSLDITDKKNVFRIFEKKMPDVVIHTAAATNVDWCETHRKETFKINVEGTKNISLACKIIGAKLVYISTDYVFDGTKNGKYNEEDKTNPKNVYAESKLEGELTLQKELEDYIISRVTVLYGYNDRFDKKCFPMRVIEALSAKKEFFCFVDQYSNPTLINDISKAILSLVKKNQKGLFHMTGSENLNRLEFAKKTAKIFGLDESLLLESSWEKSGFLAKRQPKLNISIKKLENCGIQMSDASKGLLQMKKDMENIKL